jgi:hypothetical protein
MIKETDIDLKDYYYYPGFRGTCKECCLGFIEDKRLAIDRDENIAVPCPKCKNKTGLTLSDAKKIFKNIKSYNDFVVDVRYYQKGIDRKNLRLVDMDQVTHQHYLQLEKANKSSKPKKTPKLHTYWGVFSDSTDLPNSPGASLQDSALNVGDTAYLENWTGPSDMFVCTNSTLGHAVWVPQKLTPAQPEPEPEPKPLSASAKQAFAKAALANVKADVVAKAEEILSIGKEAKKKTLSYDMRAKKEVAEEVKKMSQESKPKPKEKLDFREIALGALFNNSEINGDE